MKQYVLCLLNTIFRPADEFVIALPLPTPTELVAGKLKAAEYTMTSKLLFPNVQPSESDIPPLLS